MRDGLRPWERTKVLLFRRFFTSLAGIAAGDWARLMAENGFAVSPKYWPRAAFVTFCSMGNSVQRRLEHAIYQHRLNNVEIPPPIFILGHWRSGTTHLHKLFSLDRRLTCPTMAECLFPHSVLSGGPMRFFMRGFLPPDRIVDNVPLGVDEPFEDEFALAILTGLSPYFGWTFPRRRTQHDPRLLLDDPTEASRWKDALRRFAAKLTLKHGRPIVFKSPPHTARVRHILRVFPEARFIHIHRNPYEVFASTKWLLQQGVDGLRLQSSASDDLDDQIIARYRGMQERLGEDSRLIAPERYVEVPYADLDRDALATLERIYAELRLPPFDSLREAIRRHIADRPAFVKNRHSPLDSAVQSRLRQEWRPWFEKWQYAM